MYWLFVGLDEFEVGLFDIGVLVFVYLLVDYLMVGELEVVVVEFLCVELSEYQVGLCSENGVFVELLLLVMWCLYWCGYVDVQVEVIDICVFVELLVVVVVCLV